MSFSIPRPYIVGSAIASACGLFYVGKTMIHGGLYEHKDQKMNDKVVIVTGANTGIGKEVVSDFAARNAKVIMACRNMSKCEQARKEIIKRTGNRNVYCRLCDLASQQSIRDFVKQFKNENDKLHILVNNAGVMRCPQSYTKEGIEMQFGVNYLGHFLLTQLLLDVLKASAPARIITMSGPVHLRGYIRTKDLNFSENYDPLAAYAQSKLALVMFTVELAYRIRGSGVTINSVYPGIVNSELGRHMGYYNNYFANLFAKPFMWLFTKPPILGAQPVIHAALSPELKDVSGYYISNFSIADVSEFAKSETLSQWLWNVSEKWTGLSQSPIVQPPLPKADDNITSTPMSIPNIAMS